MSRADRRRLRRYERAVDRMTPMQRAIFLGHVVDGLSYRELAETYGIGVVEVERHLWRALGIIAEVPEERIQYWWQFWRR